MTWELAGVAASAHPQWPTMLSYTFTYDDASYDGNGVRSVARSHQYTEPNVSNVTDDGVSKLAADHLRQLLLIGEARVGVVTDLTAIKAAVTARLFPPAPVGPTADETAAEAERAALQSKIARAQAMQVLADGGLLPQAHLDELAAIKADVQRADIDTVLPALDASAVVKG